MAPFLVNHPALLNNWMMAREEALARVRSLPGASEAEIAASRRDSNSESGRPSGSLDRHWTMSSRNSCSAVSMNTRKREKCTIPSMSVSANSTRRRGA